MKLGDSRVVKDDFQLPSLDESEVKKNILRQVHILNFIILEVLGSFF